MFTTSKERRVQAQARNLQLEKQSLERQLAAERKKTALILHQHILLVEAVKTAGFDVEYEGWNGES